MYASEKMDVCGEGYGCETERVKAARTVIAGMNWNLANADHCQGCPEPLDPTQRSGACASDGASDGNLWNYQTILYTSPDSSGNYPIQNFDSYSKVAASAECCELCQATDACQAWSYNAPYSSCSLFGPEVSLKQQGSSDDTSGSKAPLYDVTIVEPEDYICAAAVTFDIDLEGGDMETDSATSAGSWKECCTICAGRGCSAWCAPPSALLDALAEGLVPFPPTALPPAATERPTCCCPAGPGLPPMMPAMAAPAASSRQPTAVHSLKQPPAWSQARLSSDALPCSPFGDKLAG